ncbi:MAG: isochorismatase family protein, partial [Burkholderiaceae bacterium]
MLLDADDCQLVLIDYQTRLMPAIADGPSVLANAVRLARMGQWLALPVWVTEQNPSKLGATVQELADVATQADASVLPKMAFSGCSDGLLQALRPAPRPQPQGGNARSLPKHLQKPAAAPEPGRNTVVIAGVEAHVCLLQTALELLEDEFEVWVVTDACGSRTERNRDAAYDRLAGNG